MKAFKKPAFLQRSLSKGSYLDGKKIKKLLNDETEFSAFLNKYFDLLDDDKSGKLSRAELKPALVRFGTLLGLPPAGTTAEGDELVDRLFTTLMADNLKEEVDRESFITISKEFLKSVSQELETKPVVVEVYDGGVLRELADNPQQFKEIACDIFKEFDEDGSGTLSRLELKPAFVSLGLVPPSAHMEVDALLSRVIGKYAGSDLQVDEGEFELMLRDMVKELSEELACRPIILSAEKKPVFTGSFVRQLTGDRNRFDAVASQLFMEWDILKRGRLSRTEITLGFKKYASSFEVQLLTPGEAEELCARVFSKADEDQSGFVEFDEFDGVLKELLNGMAKKLDRNPVVTTSDSFKSSSGLFGWFSGSSTSSSASSSAKEPEPVVPKQRSVADIKAAHNYKSKLPSAGSAGAAAADARNKLVERGEKISKLNDMADELEADTAEFSDLAAQLKKKMEKRWW
ncbi:unnamed protein product [Closterium sp. Naga37s-1]|nr:unnamed protein product [Closterium sp. Naga37s-1]